MVSASKSVAMIAAVFFLILTLTTGFEGRPKTTQEQLIKSNNTLKSVGDNRSVDEYEWSDNDDYTLDDSDSEHVIPAVSEGEKLNETEKTSPTSTIASVNVNVNSIDLSNNESEDDSSSSVATSNDPPKLPANQSVSVAPNAPTSPGSGLSETSPSSENSNDNDSNAVNLTSTTGNGLTSLDPNVVMSSSGTVNISSTEEILPSKIATQEYGDVSNNTSTHTVPDFEGDAIDSAGVRTWAVVVVSVLISFAVIFTILYFVRQELIRRRKADQRRLLRGSISSEGYFYGDGEGNISGKFEL